MLDLREGLSELLHSGLGDLPVLDSLLNVPEGGFGLVGVVLMEELGLDGRYPPKLLHDVVGT